MSKKIILNNFLKMSPEAPQYSPTNQHYLLSGVNPTYYNDSPDTSSYVGIQEQQIAPLIASQKWIQTNVYLNSIAISDITEAVENSQDVYFIDSTSYVWGYQVGGSLTGCNYPAGGAQNSSLQKVKCFAGKLFAVARTQTNPYFYYTALPATGGGWTQSSFSISSDFDPHYMEPFLEYLMMTDNTHQIIKIDSSVNKLTGIDLGTGWTVNGMRNYNDKYLAIAGSSAAYNNHFLFLWNGRSDTYNYSIKMPGKFSDMKVIDGVLYVAVWLNGTGNYTNAAKTELYYLSGNSLKPVTLPQTSTISFGFKTGIFSYLNKVGINLTSQDLMIYDKNPETGIGKYILSGGIPFSKFSETFFGWFIGVGYVQSSKRTYLYYYPTVNVNSTYNTIDYKSHWIPVKNLSGIDIYYDKPPYAGTDAISVTISGRGEDIISGTSTTTLTPITPSNYLNAERTRLDVQGFTGNLCKIELTTVNDTIYWRPNIRAIELISEN